ncbi:MAG: SAM-dependent methyltransferase [Cyclobacteriaceae bacterium]
MIEEMSRPEVVEFVHQHETDDTTRLVLSQSKHPNIPVQLVAAQIESRKKAKKKLPEWYSVQGVLFSHGVPIEQCSSEITARYKAELANGDTLVDLTGGTGIDTYYLSKKFSSTTFLECNEDLCQLAQYNFNQLKANIQVKHGFAEDFISQSNILFDWIFIDPARRDESNKKVFRISDCSPDIVEMQETLLRKSKNVLIKFSPLLDISELLRSLKYVQEIHVVSVNNDCKELLVVLSNNEGPIKVSTINFSNDNRQEFSYWFDEEQGSDADLSMPKKYLYEPNASIMKACAFKVLGSKYQIPKLHSNSHLYTADKMVENFPGRAFLISTIIPLKKSELEKLIPEGKANIATRNFPLSVQQIRKKTGLKDGGDQYIFATTLLNNKPMLIVCEKA